MVRTLFLFLAAYFSAFYSNCSSVAVGYIILFNCSKGNSVGPADVAHDKTVKSSRTVENSSQSIFRSVTELSSGGDKLSGLTSIDMVEFLSNV